jgi:hypothetical protein
MANIAVNSKFRFIFTSLAKKADFGCRHVKLARCYAMPGDAPKLRPCFSDLVPKCGGFGLLNCAIRLLARA